MSPLPPFTLVRSPRAKYLRITVYPSGVVRVTAPRAAGQEAVDRFIQKKREWILQKIEYFARQPVVPTHLIGSPELAAPGRGTRRDYHEHSDATHALVSERLKHFIGEYDRLGYKISYRRISIRNQSSRWGSCSARGNLNFNYRLLFLSPEYRDYIVVHELCHLVELNHGSRFWNLMEKTVPNARSLHKLIRKFHIK